MIIFDLHHMAWRAFHTTGELSHGADRTGVIFGVLREMQGTLQMFRDPDVVIAADSKKSLRRDIFPGYKNRPPYAEEEKAAREEAVHQINLLKNEVFPAIGIRNVFEYEGFEADDIMARICMEKKRWKKPLIVTGDEDLFQVLEHANMWIPGKRKKATAQWFMDTYGIPVQAWARYKSLAGCTSDTVPGVAGIGGKYAIDYIQGRLKKGKKLDAIEQAKADGTLDLMLKLVKLPFPGTPIPVLHPNKFNREGFLAVCDKYGFDTIAADVDEWEELLQRRLR